MAYVCSVAKLEIGSHGSTLLEVLVFIYTTGLSRMILRPGV